MSLTKLSLAGNNLSRHSPRKVWSKQIQESRKSFSQCRSTVHGFWFTIDAFCQGESDEEFVSISSNSDKAPRVSWTCEHCTYVNNPGIYTSSRYLILSLVFWTNCRTAEPEVEADAPEYYWSAASSLTNRVWVPWFQPRGIHNVN